MGNRSLAVVSMTRRDLVGATAKKEKSRDGIRYDNTLFKPFLSINREMLKSELAQEETIEKTHNRRKKREAT